MTSTIAESIVSENIDNLWINEYEIKKRKFNDIIFYGSILISISYPFWRYIDKFIKIDIYEVIIGVIIAWDNLLAEG